MNIQEHVNCMKNGMIGYRYKHFKGATYIVTDLAVNSETEEIMVVYKNFSDPSQVWVRPLDMFISKVDSEKYPDVKQEFRFKRIDNEKNFGLKE